MRATLQHALDGWKPGDVALPLTISAPDLSRSDTRSFGQTHARELAKINTDASSTASSIPLSPPTTTTGLPPSAPSHYTNSPVTYASASLPPSALRASPPTVHPQLPPTIKASSPPPGVQSSPLNPATLNQAPSPIPTLSTASPVSPVVAPNPADPSVQVPSFLPTIAETGVPKSADPGPASGNIRDLKQPSPPFVPSTGLPPSDASTEKPEKWESSEDEKKRLEREERERILAAGRSDQPDQQDGDEDLPPYQELAE